MRFLTPYALYSYNPGGHLNITEAFSSLEEHLKLLQPSGEDNKTPPTVPWLDGLLDADSTGTSQASVIEVAMYICQQRAL